MTCRTGSDSASFTTCFQTIACSFDRSRIYPTIGNASVGVPGHQVCVARDRHPRTGGMGRIIGRRTLRAVPRNVCIGPALLHQRRDSIMADHSHRHRHEAQKGSNRAIWKSFAAHPSVNLI